METEDHSQVYALNNDKIKALYYEPFLFRLSQKVLLTMLKKMGVQPINMHPQLPTCKVLNQLVHYLTKSVLLHYMQMEN